MAGIMKKILGKKLTDKVPDKVSDNVKPRLTELIILTDKIIKAADRAHSMFQEQCTEKILTKALGNLLVMRQMNCAIITIPSDANNGNLFKDIYQKLEDSICNFSWLLRTLSLLTYRAHECHGYPGLPSICGNHPILCLVWQNIATLYVGSSLEEKTEAALSLLAIIRNETNDNENAKLVIEEGGVKPLLDLVKDGKLDGQWIGPRVMRLLEPHMTDDTYRGRSVEVTKRHEKKSGKLICSFLCILHKD
ncbi:hypothetical protein AQUCO_00500073v1 [Aquilegia coerulea]|uniref:Uncharacterized protein n=1 Tax=Aquilegia coerulea TaxID=218851 RepID=A0A2G5EQ74_AQUCA|nr:hypothetical protein AQUCO_00500073v1 [Aquilegia coerulea]